MNGLLEILQNREWMVMPQFVHGIRQLLEQNLNGHLSLQEQDKRIGFAVLKGEGKERIEIKEYLVTDRGNVRSNYCSAEIDEPFVNVMSVEGPITRNGGACSYGSREIRDMIFRAADNEKCCGHVFYINTPGGSAWAKNDFQQAIEYAHYKNQPVVAFVDGMCASAGMYLAALCDERYYMHPEDTIGCIGVMAAFYQTKSGEKNAYSGDTFYELYDPQSFDKNKEIRDLVYNDDSRALVKELRQLGREFRRDVKKACPAATDEHLHGKTFKADEVKGILMDDRMSFGDVIARVFALKDGTQRPIDRSNIPEVPITPDDDNVSSGNPKTEENQQTTNMKDYKTLAAACGVEELVVTEQGTHLALELTDALTQHLEQTATEKEELEQKVKNLEQQVSAFESEKEKAVQKAVDEAKAESQADIDSAAEEKSRLEQAIAEKDASIAEKNDVLAKAEQKISDLEAKVNSLTTQPQSQNCGSPENNGASAGEEAPVCGMPVYDPNKSPMENHRDMEAYERKMKAYM